MVIVFIKESWGGQRKGKIIKSNLKKKREKKKKGPSRRCLVFLVGKKKRKPSTLSTLKTQKEKKEKDKFSLRTQTIGRVVLYTIVTVSDLFC